MFRFEKHSHYQKRTRHSLKAVGPVHMWQAAAAGMHREMGIVEIGAG